MNLNNPVHGESPQKTYKVDYATYARRMPADLLKSLVLFYKKKRRKFLITEIATREPLYENRIVSWFAASGLRGAKKKKTRRVCIIARCLCRLRSGGRSTINGPHGAYNFLARDPRKCVCVRRRSILVACAGKRRREAMLSVVWMYGCAVVTALRSEELQPSGMGRCLTTSVSGS